VSKHQNPEDFVFRRRPRLAARVDAFRPPIMWAELGIILSALNETPPAKGRTLPRWATSTLPRDSPSDYRM
jgi:hypothetical protein